mgnify:FL=1|jgi:hypothetical protein
MIEIKEKSVIVRIITDSKFENEFSKVDKNSDLDKIIDKINAEEIKIEKVLLITDLITKDLTNVFEKAFGIKKNDSVEIDFEDMVIIADRKNLKYYILEASPEKILVKDTSGPDVKDYSEKLYPREKWFWNEIISNLSENFREKNRL